MNIKDLSADEQQAVIALFHKIFCLDVNTGKLYWKESAPGLKAGTEAGCLISAGYRMVRIGTRASSMRIQAHRVVFAMVHGRFPEPYTDHINGIRDDNRPCNLREASRAQNGANAKKPSNNTSGIKGVKFNSRRNKWFAKIAVNNKIIWLGSFSEKEDAARAYEAAAKRFNGEFARVA